MTSLYGIATTITVASFWGAGCGGGESVIPLLGRLRKGECVFEARLDV